MKFAKSVVKYRIPILLTAALLMLPSFYCMTHTRINYDMLAYLPDDMDTVKGQDELMEDFGKGAFSFIVVEGMPVSEVSALKSRIEQVDHVETVLWYDSISDISVPMELLPDKLYNAFNSGDATMMAVFFDSATSADVTMDYSIFLWHCYNEKLRTIPDSKEAMAAAIRDTLLSVAGSSTTTVAGFAALCFMTFTLGRDLGLVMAKGVLLGVICCVTVLPALILLLNKPLQSTRHRPLIPDMTAFSKKMCGIFPVFLLIFLLLIPPSYYGYKKTNKEVYYDMGQCLPRDIQYVVANEKLSETFNVASTHMLLVDSSLSPSEVRQMAKDMEKVPGVKYVLGLESVLGAEVPEELLPEELVSTLKSGRSELLLVNSEYKVASDEVDGQIDSLNAILKRYDPSGMLIGEAPCMKDMIETTDHDFKVVNAVSIAAIFIIIAIVEKSISLPFILIAVIELAIFINLGLPHYLGQSLPFIAPICISTIQLGATVDYAILMTTRYKAGRRTKSSKESAAAALAVSLPSIIVSGCGLFAATFGVAVYSDMDIISSMCMLMARGAIISVLMVAFILPAMLILCDKAIIATTLDMRKNVKPAAESAAL